MFLFSKSYKILKVVLILSAMSLVQCKSVGFSGNGRTSKKERPSSSNPGKDPQTPGQPVGEIGPILFETPGSYCSQLQTKSIQKTNPRSDAPAGTILEDIVKTLPSSYNGSTKGYGNTYYSSNPHTWAHETSHGISAHIMNNFTDNRYGDMRGTFFKGFYLTGGRYVSFPEPRLKSEKVPKMIPNVLKDSRYHYISTGYPEHPLEIFNEWIAYINGAFAGVELANKGLFDPTEGSVGSRTNIILAVVEVGVYATGFAQAVSVEQPSYLAQNPQFKVFLGCQWERAVSIYKEGYKIPAFNYDNNAYFNQFRTSGNAAPLREFASSFFGSGWTKQVLGF